MTEKEFPLDDLRGLAEDAIADKREESGSEAQARELYDLPTESAEDLAVQQENEQTGTPTP